MYVAYIDEPSCSLAPNDLPESIDLPQGPLAKDAQLIRQWLFVAQTEAAFPPSVSFSLSRFLRSTFYRRVHSTRKITFVQEKKLIPSIVTMSLSTRKNWNRQTS